MSRSSRMPVLLLSDRLPDGNLLHAMPELTGSKHGLRATHLPISYELTLTLPQNHEYLGPTWCSESKSLDSA